MNVKSAVTGLSVCAPHPAASLLEYTCASCLFPFMACGDETPSRWWKTKQTKKNTVQKKKKKKNHRWRRLTPTGAQHSTHHQRRCISRVNATALWAHKTLCQTNDLARRCETMCLMNLRCTCTLRVGGWLEKKGSEKQSSNDKYKRNLSHKICPEASVWTGCGQRHQSREAPPLASH